MQGLAVAKITCNCGIKLDIEYAPVRAGENILIVCNSCGRKAQFIFALNEYGSREKNEQGFFKYSLIEKKRLEFLESLERAASNKKLLKSGPGESLI